MTTEELLKPRYKVIADFPLSACAIGQIFTVENEGDFVGVVQGGAWKTDISAYPHLFKRLEWYEELATDEMPDYLRNKKHGHVIYVSQWEGFNVNNIPLFNYRISTQHPWTRGLASEWEPATPAEYESFISNSKPKIID